MIQNSSEGKIVVSVRNLCKDYQRPNGSTFTVLESINFDIYDNEFVAILGLSGSGKSTLLRCMAGLVRPDRGDVTYTELPHGNERRMSFVFQSFGLFPWFTVRENVGVALKGVPEAEKHKKIDHILELVGLSGFEDAFPRELSGGMKQRVGFCRAMIGDPMVLFMDEPFGALDPLTSESLRSEIGRVWTIPDRKIRSIVFVTHNLEEALQLADRIIILSSNPGMIFKVIDNALPRPRTSTMPGYNEAKQTIEKSFGELHLSRIEIGTPTQVDKVGGDPHFHGPTQLPVENRHSRRTVVPIINVSLVDVEGLVTHLESTPETVNIYDLCDTLGQSIDQLMPSVMAAEILGFVVTPGIDIMLTPFGHKLGQETELSLRKNYFKEACLKHPLIAKIYELVSKNPEEGLEQDIVLEQIIMQLPFEDPDTQFDALVKWSRYADMMNFDRTRGRLLPSVD